MYHYQRLTYNTAQPYLPLTDPALRPLLAELDTPTDSQPIAIGAMFWGQPVGIALAHYHASTQQAELLDIFIAPACRRAGMGTTLLATLEAVLIEQGCQKIELLYQTDEHSPYLERVLQKRGWTAPTLKSCLFWSTIRAGEVRWVDQSRLSAAYQVFPWAELTAPERQMLEARQDEGFYPPSLSPFLVPDDQLSSLNSIGLRHQGQVVGWLLTRVQEQGQAELVYETLFVSPELQPLGIGIKLLAEALRRQQAQNDQQKAVGIWRVAPDNQPMLRFVERGLGSWLTHRAEERSCFKALTRP